MTTQSKTHYINQMSTISTHRGSEMRLTSAENLWKSPIQPPALHRSKVKVNSGCQSLIQSSFEKSPRMEMPQPLCQHCCCLNSVSCNSSQNSQLAVIPVCTKTFGLLGCKVLGEHLPASPQALTAPSRVHTSRSLEVEHTQKTFLTPISKACELA